MEKTDKVLDDDSIKKEVLDSFDDTVDDKDKLNTSQEKASINYDLNLDDEEEDDDDFFDDFFDN